MAWNVIYLILVGKDVVVWTWLHIIRPGVSVFASAACLRWGSSLSQCRLKVAGGPGPDFHMGPFTTFLPSTASPSSSIPSTTNLIALRVFIMQAVSHH